MLLCNWIWISHEPQLFLEGPSNVWRSPADRAPPVGSTG